MFCMDIPGFLLIAVFKQHERGSKLRLNILVVEMLVTMAYFENHFHGFTCFE